MGTADKLSDLLLGPKDRVDPKPLSVHLDSSGMVVIQNITERPVVDAASTRAALLNGLKHRQVVEPKLPNSCFKPS